MKDTVYDQPENHSPNVPSSFLLLSLYPHAPSHTPSHTHTMQEVVLSSVAQNFELVEDRYREWCREKQECNDKVHTLHIVQEQDHTLPDPSFSSAANCISQTCPTSGGMTVRTYIVRVQHVTALYPWSL